LTENIQHVGLYRELNQKLNRRVVLDGRASGLDGAQFGLLLIGAKQMRNGFAQYGLDRAWRVAQLTSRFFNR
jgi:hypothetical protein